jgi:adenylate cyclase
MIGRWIEQYLKLGVAGYPRLERRRLLIANLAGLLAALSCLGYAGLFATQVWSTTDGRNAFGWAVWSNLLCAVLYLSTPLWHRWGLLAGAANLLLVAYVSMLWFGSRFGLESGIHLNFLTAIAIATVLIGNRVFWLLAAIGFGLLAHVYAHFNFTDPVIDRVEFGWLLRMLYINTVSTFVLVVSLVVWYAFRIAANAEAQSERLLRNILPDEIATRLKEQPDEPIAERFSEASVLFADLVGFTPIFGKMPAEEMVRLLNEIFCAFDELCQRIGAEKIKTIGDAYMVVAGAPTSNPNHAVDLIRLAEKMLHSLAKIEQRSRLGLQLRIGIASGPITAGIIGRSKFAYDVWSPTVNLAARLEANGEVGRIHIADETRRLVGDRVQFEPAEAKELKGIGFQQTWLVISQ